jgi:hypothetical protein
MHQALTACTLGAWGIVWAALTVDWITRKPWRCRFCGHRLRPSADLSTGVPDAAPALSLPRAIPSPP